MRAAWILFRRRNNDAITHPPANGYFMGFDAGHFNSVGVRCIGGGCFKKATLSNTIRKGLAWIGRDVKGMDLTFETVRNVEILGESVYFMGF
jgi:hypothetical protein